MSRKTKTIIIAAALLAAVLIILFARSFEKGTIMDFADDAVVVALEDEKTVIRFEDYLAYTSPDEQLSIGDKVKIRYNLFNHLDVLSINRLPE